MTAVLAFPQSSILLYVDIRDLFCLWLVVNKTGSKFKSVYQIQVKTHWGIHSSALHPKLQTTNGWMYVLPLPSLTNGPISLNLLIL
uniref:Uncharacterized protein n=1 Tax=Pyxicephalus adspersus TaxID=30357 RepID=A0AAV3AIG1_PYXAD|nr:TPA: hypothetical protein GDO54_011314 [Pyxicephalus adspersus]